MAKIPRTFQQLFGLNGSQSHFGQFGSRAGGPPGLTTKDPSTIQALSAFLTNGWTDAVDGTNKAPFLEDMNGLHYLIFFQLCNLFQDGIPAWEATTPYYIGSIVRKDGTTEMYGSLIDNNVGHTLPNQTADANWNYLNPQSVAVGQISDFGNGVPFGYLACDGSAYPSASYPALSTYLAGVWDTFNGAASPGVGNFRVPDLRSLTTIGAGQGVGFTNRVLATLVGAETHTLTVPEIPANLTVSDPGHLHSLVATGSTGVVAVQSSGPNQNISGGGPPGGSFRVTATLTATTGITVGGGGQAHNIMQPSAVTTKAIKY